MAKLNYVKKARKAHKHAGIKKGESYYWWSMAVGGRFVKYYSKEMPPRSRLTNSEFLGAMYDAEDALHAAIDELRAEKITVQDLAEAVREAAGIVTEQGEECQAKADNLSDAFPSGCPTIELLEERVSACEELAQELEQAADTIDDLADEKDGAEEAAQTAEDVSWSYE
jgi:hypothetical protein